MKYLNKILWIAVSIIVFMIFTEIHGYRPVGFQESVLSFHDLPKEVQDTVLYWTKHQGAYFTNSDSLIKQGQGTPIVISFAGRYTLENEKIGPWVKWRVLTRISDGKEYRLSRNVDEPLIVRNDTLLIPDNDNILYNLNSQTKFRIRKLR